MARFVYDLVRTGNLTHPIAYGKEFYRRFPGITIPYHPPVFPLVEAISYAMLGVIIFAARLPVALAAGLCTILVYRLVKSTHQTEWLAWR